MGSQDQHRTHESAESPWNTPGASGAPANPLPAPTAPPLPEPGADAGTGTGRSGSLGREAG